MATTVRPAPGHAPEPYSEQSGLWSWLTTVDHKRIGILYLYTALGFFIWGGIEAVIIRAQLGRSQPAHRLRRVLQPAIHDARDDHDLPRDHAALGSVLQFPDSAPDRRARRRLPAPECLQLLGLSVRRPVHLDPDPLRRRLRTAAGSVTRRSRRGPIRRASTSTSG